MSINVPEYFCVGSVCLLPEGRAYTNNAKAQMITTMNVEAGVAKFENPPELRGAASQTVNRVSCSLDTTRYCQTYCSGTPVILTVNTATKPSIAGRPSVAILHWQKGEVSVYGIKGSSDGRSAYSG